MPKASGLSLALLALVLGSPRASAVVLDLPDLPQAWRVAVADFDGNGRLEFGVLGRQGSLWTYDETAPLTYARSGPISIGPAGADLLAVDLQHDGDADLVAVSGVRAQVECFWNFEGQFSPTAKLTLFSYFPARSVACPDVEGNGWNDVIITGARPGTGSGALTMWGADTGGAYSSGGPLLMSPRPERIASDYLDGDSAPDLLITCPDHDVVLLVLQRMDISGNWNIAYAQRTPIAVPNPTWTATADFDGDGDRDIAVTSAETNAAFLIDNNGDATFAAPVAIAAGERPGAIQAFDVDSDGDVDLAMVLEAEHRIAVLRNDGSGGFRAAEHGASVPGVPAGFGIADLDGDGVAEAVVALPELGRVAIRSLDGRTAFDPGDEPTPLRAQPGGARGPAPVTERLRLAATTTSNGNARIALSLAAATSLRLTVYDAMGRRVRELHAGDLAAGRHDVAWDGRDSAGRIAPSGIYFAQAAAPGESAVARVVWLGSRR